MTEKDAFNIPYRCPFLIMRKQVSIFDTALRVAFCNGAANCVDGSFLYIHYHILW